MLTYFKLNWRHVRMRTMMYCNILKRTKTEQKTVETLQTSNSIKWCCCTTNEVVRQYFVTRALPYACWLPPSSFYDCLVPCIISQLLFCVPHKTFVPRCHDSCVPGRALVSQVCLFAAPTEPTSSSRFQRFAHFHEAFLLKVLGIPCLMCECPAVLLHRMLQ